jgi:hypothetical protein
MDQFEQDYRNERRKALRDSVKSGKTSLPVGILQHGANRIGEGVSDTVQGIGAFAKSLYNNPQAAVESGAEGLEALYNSVAQEDPMAAMQVAQMVASGGTGAAILRGGRIDPSAVGSGGGNILRGFHSTQKDFDEIDPERGLPTGNFGQAAYFSESNDYPSRLNPNSRIIEADLDTTNFLQAGKKIPVAKERVLGTLSVLNSLEDATGKPFKVEYDADTNTALVEYNRRRRAGEEGPIKETKTFDFNNSSKLFDDIKSVTWGLRYESMSTDRTNLSDFMKAAGFTGVKGGSDDDFHIGVFDKSAVKQFAQGGPVMRGIGTLNETARNMFRGPRGVGAYQQFASGGEAMGPPPTRGPDPQGIGYFQQFADGGPVYMQEGGDPFAEVDFDKLTAAVIQTESAGDPNAVSEDDAIGLMQVLPSTGAQPGYEKLGAQNVFDIAIDLGFPIDDSERTVEKARELLFEPEINVAFGTKYLRAMIAHSGGDIKQALQKYNAGTGNYQAFVEGRKPLDQEAVRYPVLVANALTGGNLAMPEASSFTPTPVQRGEDLIMSMPVAQSDAMSLLAIENRREGTEFQGQDAYSAGENLSRQTRQDFGSQAQQDDFEIEEEEQESIMEKYSPESMGEQLKGGQGSVPPQRAPMLDTIEEFFNKFKPPKKPPFTVYPKLTDPLA